MKSSLKLLLIILMAGIAACSRENETGISLKVVGTNNLKQSSGLITKSAGIVTDNSADQFTFTEALLGISKIEIKGKEESESVSESESESESEDSQGEDGNEYEFKGAYLVDLLNGTTTPEPGFAIFAPGVYTNFEAKTARIVNGTKTVSIKGSFTDAQSKSFKFELSTDAEVKFEYESETGFELPEGHILDLILKINLPSIFEGVDFGKGVMNSDNVIVINENTNTALLYIIKSNLRTMAEMDEENDD